MVLYFGGAFQGKRELAKQRFSLDESAIFTCENEAPDFSYPCIDHLERYTLACLRAGIDPVTQFEAHRSQWTGSILIVQDISGGVVPISAEMRAWQRLNGRFLQYLVREATHISRVFCGMEESLK